MALDHGSTRKWYKAKEVDPHLALFEWVARVENKQSSRTARNRENLARYTNRRFAGLQPGDLSSFDIVYDDLTLNVVHSAISTVASKICMQKPRPFFLTENGKYEDQERARLLQKFVQGVLHQNRVYEDEGPKSFIDSAVFDIGALKVFGSQGKIKVQRILPEELIIDEDEAHTARPRNMGQRKPVTKDMLASWFPKFKSEIYAAKTIYNHATNDLTDMIRVVEAWHLPSSPDAGDGKHIIAIDGCTLLIEEWKHAWFPFAWIRWDDRPVGFFGQGLVEQLAPIQDEINKIMQRIQESMHLLAVAWVILDKGSGINKKHLKNVNAIILEKSGGNDPRVQLNPGVNPQVFEYLDYLYQKAYELAGVSQLSANSKRPEGLRSGAALRTLLDTESVRFGLLGRQWESLFTETARLIVSVAQDMEKDGTGVSVSFADKEWMEKIDWKNCGMDDDQYTTVCYPTSNLPSTPAGKLALIEELQAIGAVQDPSVALDLLQMPDVEKFAAVETAPVKSAHQICEFILAADGNWIPPEEFMNLQLCVTIAQKYWIKGHIDKAPSKRLDALAEWINQAMDIMNPQPLVDPTAPQSLGSPVAVDQAAATPVGGMANMAAKI